MNHVTGLAGILGHEGYQTAFFHGAQRGSMGFMAFAKSTGFQEYYGREDFDKDKRFDGDKDFDGTWAIWDEPFLQYYATKMGEMKQPFMTAVFTASSHHPYVVPEKYKKVYPEEGIIIHKCIRYTDMAIRKFFENAKKQPWYNNTIFVLTSDHTNLSDHEQYQTDIGGFCSPIIIFEPGSDRKPEIQDKVAQQIDILPTVLGMLNYPKPYFGFGIDVLNTPKEETWAVNYLNGIYQYVKHGYVMKKLLNYLVYVIVYGTWYVASLLPLRVLYIFSDFLYLLIAHVVKYRHKVIWKNLNNSFPEKSDAELRQIEKDFYHYFCDYLVETIKGMSMSEKQIRRRMTFSGTILGNRQVERVLGKRSVVCRLSGTPGQLRVDNLFAFLGKRQGTMLSDLPSIGK